MHRKQRRSIRLGRGCGGPPESSGGMHEEMRRRTREAPKALWSGSGETEDYSSEMLLPSRWRLYETAGKVVYHAGAWWLQARRYMEELFPGIRHRSRLFAEGRGPSGNISFELGWIVASRGRVLVVDLESSRRRCSIIIMPE